MDMTSEPRSGGFVEYISLPTLVLVVIACAAAAVIEVALVTDWSGSGSTSGASGQAAPASDNRADPSSTGCRICGVVESVRQVSHDQKQPVSTIAGGGPEGVALLLGVLTGNVKFSPPLAYETQVRMNDGSVRATREFQAPEWKPGDPVRLMRGRIEPMPGPEASQQHKVERTVPTHALCEAESDGKVLVAWKNGRHYCFRYGGSDLHSAATPAG